MKRIVSLVTLTLIPFVILLGGCGPGDNKPPYTGSVTTFAGLAGASGVTDTPARFNSPSGITIDGTNLYITDTDSHTIRKIAISASGVPVTTPVAGTAGLNFPFGITTDGFYLYVADTGNNVIRRIDISSGTPVISTLAGGSPGYNDGIGASAMFNSPFGIVSVGSYPGTYLYVADTLNNTIRKIDSVTGAVTTIAGNAASGVGSTDNAYDGKLARFNKPEGITTDGFSLYVTDTGNNTIRRIDISSSGVPVTTLAGAPPPSVAGSANGTGIDARFNSPVGIVRDGANLYVADSGNNTIRKIEIVTLKVTTLAGAANSPFPPSPNSGDGTGAAARFNNPTGITSDGTSLYVTDTGNHTIRRIQ